MANGNFMHGFLNDMEMGEEIDPSTTPDTIVEEVVDANNEVIESSKDLKALTNANTELTEINNEMDVALESNAGPAVMRLILNRYANLKSKLGIPVSGLEADSKNLDVTADDVKNAKEESKGVFAKIGDFISKVWKAIKDGIAKVWSKMKEFWAWLTGKNKKAKNQIVKSEIAKAVVNVAADTKVDLENKEELSQAVKKELDKTGITDLPTFKEFDEMMLDPTVVISLDTMKAVRAEPAKAKKTLEDLMNKRIEERFQEISGQFVSSAALTYGLNILQGDGVVKLGDINANDLLDILASNKNENTKDAKINVGKGIEKVIKRNLSMLNDAEAYITNSDTLCNEGALAFEKIADREKEECIMISELINNELKKPGDTSTRPISISFNTVVSAKYDRGLSVKLLSPVYTYNKDIDSAMYLLKELKVPKWTPLGYNVTWEAEVSSKTIDSVKKISEDTIKIVDATLKTVESSKDVSRAAALLAKQMANNTSILSASFATALNQQSKLFSDVVDMLDITDAIAELAKQ